MKSFLVTLRSHAVGPTDEVFVKVSADSFLAAIREAVRACPAGPWAFVSAVPWPRRAGSVEDVARRKGAIVR